MLENVWATSSLDSSENCAITWIILSSHDNIEITADFFIF